MEYFGGNSALGRGFDSVDWPQPLSFTADSPGRMFAKMPPALMKAFSTQNITYNLHSAGVTPGKHPALEKVVSVLATSVDRRGKPFVAAMEHRSLWIYGTQFHPEKPEFGESSWAAVVAPCPQLARRCIAFVPPAPR